MTYPVLYTLLSTITWWIHTTLYILGIIFFIIGTITAVLSGRKYARYIHDIKLIHKKQSITMIPALILLIISIILNIFSFIMTTIIFLPLRLLLSKLNIIAALTPIIYSIIITLISYIIFKYKYRNINEPLTIEAKIINNSIKTVSNIIKKSKKNNK